MLLRFFHVRPVLAVVAAVVYAVEPLQILHERLVLTESFAMLLLAIYLLFGLWYVTRPTVSTLVALAVTGTLLLSLRLIFAPVMLFNAVFLPLLAWAPRNGLKRMAAHLALSVLVTLGLHQAYKVAIGLRAHGPPAYQYEDGFFLISAWAPLLKPEDATDPRARHVVEKQAVSRTYPLQDRGSREAQRWRTDGGLVSELVAAFGGDRDAANLAARRMCIQIARRVPLSVARIARSTYVDYWRALPNLGPGLLDEQGTLRGPGPELLAQLQAWFGLDAAASAVTMTPSKRYHLLAVPWYLMLALSPLAGFASVVLCRAGARRAAVLVATTGAVLLAVTCVTASEFHTRYLHPLVFGDLVAAAVVANRIWSWRHPEAPQADGTSILDADPWGPGDGAGKSQR